MGYPYINGSIYTDAGDRRIRILVTMANPSIVVLENLLDEKECEALIRYANPRLKRSTTTNTTGGAEVHKDRTSNGMFFARGENELIKKIETRISKLIHWPEDHGEEIQVVQYTRNGEYKPHYDFFDLATAKVKDRGGQRVGTLIIYLSDPVEGGGTVFPKLNLEILPKRGNAVFFNYPGPVPDQLTLHGGAPVLKGEKWIATKWLRESSIPQTTESSKKMSWVGNLVD